MFSFKPVKWFSSLLLSKFLKPYLKNFEQQNVDVQMLDGQVCLKNLELKNDVLMQFGIDFEIIDSFLGEVKLVIPWNNLKTKEITAEISNAKIVISNKIEMSNFNKEQYKEHIEKLKKEILAKFDENVAKEDSFSNGSQGSSFFTDFVIKVLGKFVLKINNLDIIFIYQINNYEIVKFGFGFSSLLINQDETKPKQEEIRKRIQADNIFLLFEVFDNALPTQLQPESFIRDQTLSKLEEKKAVHILKKLGLNVEVSVTLSTQMEIELKVATVSNVLIYLKQRQIRLLLRAMQDIVNHRNDRPKDKPKQGKTAKSWWMYVIKRVIEKEYIRTKVRKQEITNYFKVQQYLNIYSKKMLKQYDAKRDGKLMSEFEAKNSVSQILILRSMAIDKILEQRNNLRSNNPKDQQLQKDAQGWFRKFQSDFNMEHASNLKFSKSVVDSYLSFMKEKESNTRITIILDVKQVNILIQENQILQQLRNLHEQVDIFKKELIQKKSLQAKVLDHIKDNFLQKLTKVTVKSSEINRNDDWRLEELLKEKILINLELTSIKFELVKQGQFKQLIKAQLQKLILYDTNRFNVCYKKIIEISEGVKVLMSSEQLEKQRKILDLDPLEKTIQVYLDIQAGPLNITLCKPLYERLISLQNLVFFDKTVPQNSNSHYSKYFDNFLISSKRVQSNTNLSFSISRINVYLPLQYKIKTQMLLIHLKQIKIFKREHENSVVNIYPAENSNGQVSQYLKDLKTRQTVNRVAQQTQNLDEGQNLKPLYFTVDCLRLAFVQDYDWEEKENIFKIQYRKLCQSEQLNGDPGIETMIETLPIKIRMEQSQKMIQIESDKLKSRSKRKFKKKIYPKTSTITIQLPFLDLKVSIKHLYLILQLTQIWQAKGYDFYDVIDNKVKKQEVKVTPQHFSEQIQKDLKEYMISQVSIDMDGVQFQFTINTQEFLDKFVKMPASHNNRLFSFYFLNLHYQKENRFFDSVQQLAIHELALQNISCHSYELQGPLKVLASQLLKYSDCEKEARQSSFGNELEKVMNSQSEIQEVGGSKQSQLQKSKQEQVQKDEIKQLDPLNETVKENVADEIEDNQQPQTIFSQKKNQFQILSPKNSFLDNDNRETFEDELYIKEFYSNSECQNCMNDKNHRLLLNFIKPKNLIKPDVYFLQKSDSNKSTMEIELCQLNLLLDPEIITNLRLIFDIGSLAAEIKKLQFIRWMRENGFWPDFKEVDQKQQPESQQFTCITSELVEEKSRIEVRIEQVALLLYYSGQVVYLMNMKNVETQISSSTLFQKININMNQVRLFDTAIISGKHRTMLEDYDEENQNDIQCQIQICNNADLIRIRKYATFCGVRIKKAKIVFLKRNTNEIQYYIRKVLLSSFSTTLKQKDRNDIMDNIDAQNISFESQPEEIKSDPEFGFKFSLVALNSLGIGYRSSLSDDALYIQFQKVGFWFSGIWGNNYDNLIKTGLFDDEIEEEQKINETFVDAKFSQDPSMASETVFKDVEDQPDEVIDKSIQIVAVWGLEIRCCPGQDPNDLFVKAPDEKESLILYIDFCDDTQDKVFCHQEIKPMRITINIEKLNLYAYDLDYCTICKFFMDNLGEQAQTIIGKYNYDEFNENIWMVLDININKAIAKFFKGTREECRVYYHTKNPSKEHYLLYKNPASIAVAKLETLNYQFMMRENGGKFMRLTAQQITLSDFRKTSTMKHSKEILFSVIEDQFKCDEEQSSSDARQEEFNKNLPNFFDEVESQQEQVVQTQKLFNSSKPLLVEQQQKSPKPLDLKDISLLPQDAQSQASQNSRKKRSSRWDKFVNEVKNIFCCRKRNLRRNQSSKSKNKSTLDNIQLEKEHQQLLIKQKLDKLLDYPPEPMLNRRWINYRERQALPITIENNNNLNDGDKDDYEYYFDHIQKQDLYFLMKTKPDGEKLIKIKLENKNIILLIDFLVEVVQFFRTPYNGSDKQKYQMQPHFNNFPPMVIQIDVFNVWAIVLGDLNKETFDKSKSIGILLDCNYSQKWLGDSWFGPGSCEKNIEATLKKLYIFQTNHIISLKQTDTVRRPEEKLPPLRSLLEPFKVCINMKYSVDFFRDAIKEQEFYFRTKEGFLVKEYYEDFLENKTKFQSKNEWHINLINSTKLKNNFSLSIRDIAELQQIVNIFSARKSPDDKYTFYRKQPPPDSFVDDCINTKIISIEMFKIQILKNKDGVKAAQFELKNLRMSDFKDNEESKLKLLACISLDYFNKRKMDFEPFLEPWIFKVTMIQKVEKPPENRAIDRDSKKIVISNYIEKQLKGEEVPYYLKDHTNSLNINLTPALVEVTMEALKIYNQQMEDEEPYKIFNRCGYALEIRDFRKDQPVRIIKEDSEYTYNTQKELWAKEFKRHKSDQQHMLLNLVILKPESNKEEEKDEDEVKTFDFQAEKNSLIMRRTTVEQYQTNLKSQKEKLSLQYLNLNTNTTNNVTNMTSSQYTKEKKYQKQPRNDKNISNYKTIKFVNFDFVGKKFYPLVRLHKNEQQEQHNTKKGAFDNIKTNFDKITNVFLVDNRKINEDRNIFIQVNVNINPQNGSKEIQIQSTVKIYNYLSTTLELGFQINGQMKETTQVILGPKQIYIVPLEFLENKTEVRFTPEKSLKHQQDEQLERKYYQLDTLLCDQQSLGEFEVDKDNSILEVLEQATQIVTSFPGKCNPVIKSEFKQIQDPLNYKQDHVITSMKSNIKRNNFYFVINCVKIKNQITFQRRAHNNFAGTQDQTKNEYDNDVCYETYLICYPIFKFTNATVRDLNIHYGVFSQNKQQQEKSLPYTQVMPDQHFYCESLDYHDDIELCFSFVNQKNQENGENLLDEQLRTKPFKIFNRGFGLGEENKISVKFKQASGNDLYLTALVKKRSTKSRELVLYCPYLIFNETSKLLMFQEYGLTQDILSNDWTYYQNFSKTYSKNKQKKEIEQHSQYHNLHMFSTSSNMNKIQIAIGEMNDQSEPTTRSKWSNPVSLQNSNVIEIIGSTEILKRDHEQMQSNNKAKKISADAKGKFEFGMAITSAPGSFHRSKLITITPRFIVHNETQNNIAMAQVDTEYRDSNLLRLKPGDWKYFSWSNIKRPYLAMISFYQESTGLISGWSGYFKLQVQEISFKLPSIKPIINNNNSDSQQQYILQKVNITLMDDLILLIRFISEDPIIPPYYIENLTKYEISYKQQPSSSAQKYRLTQANPVMQNNDLNRGIHQVIANFPIGNQDQELIQFSAGGNEITTLQPGERVAFTWDNWIDDKEHVLEVEIEGQAEKYEIDKIQNFTPLVLPGQNQKRKKLVNKKFLYKQGEICIKELDKFKPFYCTLNVIKQKFNVYTQDRKQHESYYLQGAKVEESKDNEFVLKINPEKMLSTNIHFQTKTVDESNQWIDYLWRAIQIDKPEMVELKIEPSNQTKVVTFYQNTQNDRADAQGEGQDNQFEKEEDQQRQQFTSYKISISNCVSISIIDETPKEIIQVCFKNIQAEYIQIEETQKDLLLKANQDDEENTNLLQEKPQVLQIKEYINLSIDLIIINNQLINSQFPVLLAPNKKKIFGNQQPFFVLQIYRKDQTQVKKQNNNITTNASKVTMKNEQPGSQQNQVNDKQICQQNQSKFKISYIHTLQMFTDTLEIRLDHQILDQIIQYYNQISAIIWDSNFSDVQQHSTSQFGLGSLQKKQEEQLKKIQQHSISKIYLKNLMLEPIDICFTLKSSPGHVMNSSSIGVIADLGLTLASIDSAKIRLNAFKTQHIFGSSNEIIGRISKHYKGQFLTQIYKLLGSFEIFGNPVSLISNLGTGVIDMFYEPLYALVTGKSGYKVGEKFFTGAVTLIHTSITGVYKTVQTIIGTIMKILDQITLDKKYMSERSNRLNRAIKNFREGFIIGFTNFGKILFQTVIGILERPITGINDGGFLGFLLGIYQGIMGIIIKPTVGIYDLLITIIEGIKNTAIYEEHIMDTRYRPPRIFGEFNQLIPFNFKHAIGTDIIRRYKLKVIEGENIIFFDQINISEGKKKKIEAQIVLTDTRIVYVLSHSSIHCDKIMVYKIKSMRFDEKKKLLKFKLHTPVRKSWFDSNSTRYSLKYESKIKAIKLAEQMQISFKDRYNIILKDLRDPSEKTKSKRKEEIK